MKVRKLPYDIQVYLSGTNNNGIKHIIEKEHLCINLKF